jgi:acetoacetyl-CoA synthetase
VATLAAAQRKRGIGVGDSVAAFMPNITETVVGMLAATSLGAIWTSCSPDFGLHGVVDRFGQTRPKLLIACDGYRYKGKHIDSLPLLAQLLEQVDSIDCCWLVPVLARDEPQQLDGFRGGAALIERFDRLLAESVEGEIAFVRLPFNHPLYVLYSSGTTGRPKCIVHGAGGTLLQHLKEHGLHAEMGEGDRYFYYTTCGWTMWNILVSGLALGCTLVLYDGSPFHPHAGALIDLIDDEGITVFGVSARYIASLEKSGVKPRQSHRLDTLKTVMSTGSPLAHESFDYVYREMRADICLSSISGGTDIISCFVAGSPTLPVYRGELQCLGLGMAVEFRDEAGHPLPEGRGELVCVKPFVSKPLGFWGDEGDHKFREAYFSRFPGIWAHGDFGELRRHDDGHVGVIIHGRSDAVLNPGGVRIGTAEIYRQVDKVEEVLESVCIGQEWQGDTRVVLFVLLREGLALDEALQTKLRETIARNTTSRHVPARILQVADIPRTLSGKIVELAVREVVHGRSVKNTDALANPQALAHFRNRPELAC